VGSIKNKTVVCFAQQGVTATPLDFTSLHRVFLVTEADMALKQVNQQKLRARAADKVIMPPIIRHCAPAAQLVHFKL